MCEDTGEPEHPPKLSLIIPAYNEAKYITPTLESVARARRKFEETTGEQMEVIVVDNDSTDRTADIARGFGSKVVPFEKHQIAAVRNAGAKAARGEYLAFVDADRSILPEDSFVEIADNLADETVYGGGTAFRPEKWSVLVWFFVMFFRLFCLVFGVGFVLYYLRRADFDALGGWNEALYMAEDMDLSFRMKRAAKAAGRTIRNLRGKVGVCTRKLHLLPPLRALWWSLPVLIRRDFSSPKAAHPFFYDVDNLR